MATMQDKDVVLEKEKQKIKPPKQWQVIVFNDDFTPMDFVMGILQAVFQKSAEEAYDLTMTIHTAGQAVVAVMPHDFAQTKCQETLAYARANSFPLYCEAREEPDSGKD